MSEATPSPAGEPTAAAPAGGAPSAAAPADDPARAALREAEAAFERGDYARVRVLCRSLREGPSGDVAGAAAELEARTRPDPSQIAVVLGCLALLLLVAAKWVF